MKIHQYSNFIEWTANTYLEERKHADKDSQETRCWLRSYGITAGRVNAYLRGRQGSGATMPNSLVMDILEIGHSKERETVEELYSIDALLSTWSALAQVYGRTATPAELEVARVELIAEAAYALIMTAAQGFPGRGSLLRLYWQESELLDLTLIRKSTPGLSSVGANLELIKRFRKDLPKKPKSLHLPRRRKTLEGASQPITPVDQGAVQPVADPKSDIPTAKSITPVDPYGEDRLPALPTSGRHWSEPSKNSFYWVYGNWPDRWDNTLPY
ncbi:hypothetical protein LRQ04_16275 [Paenarthrobacter sp. AR 02]|uniref:hypothetical protein n=1 Tax=Paenarthrobacter sp. AR 02 TaxID=2899821 RepID=UPI001F24C5E5|nr:hypothetical protein [Paenarthrobacter sp. AR 02]MCF3140813.1 hypothetical protein [Paenarthrobacter sp. AR 02]